MLLSQTCGTQYPFTLIDRWLFCCPASYPNRQTAGWLVDLPIFTHPTSTGETKSADEILKERFADVGRNPQAFSSIKYVGTKTLNNNTSFQELFQTVIELTNDTSVRSRRPIAVIYDVLNVRVYSIVIVPFRPRVCKLGREN